MIVIEHEGNTKKPEDLCSYDNTSDTLIFSEGILNELNSDRDVDLAQYNYFYDEMEKIHNGDTSHEKMVKLDEYFGSIGLATEPAKTSMGAKPLITVAPATIQTII